MAAIVLDRVSRRYQKYASRHRFQTFKSAVVKGDLFGSLKAEEMVAAVDDVSLSIEKGTTLGLIGSNGSGKSTLLKLIAGIAKPTSGTVSVEGKISALIELGAGFHPEISGRENVFINGIMLGLSKKEIAAKFDEIVRFAGLVEFIDAPVKTYSSGMFMRLGFSIAINVNPDVLLVDEVLAVGDAAFIPKCLDRIDDFRRRKKTILFVSHDLGMVAKICDQVAWMKDGRLRLLGDPQEVVDAYLQDVAEKQESDYRAGRDEPAETGAATDEAPAPGGDDGRRARRWGKREIEIRKVVLRGLDGAEKHVFSPEEGMLIELDVAAKEPQKDFVFGIGVFNSLGTLCYGTNTDLEEHEPEAIEGGGKVVCRIDRLGLVNGTYYLDVAAHKRDGYPFDYHRSMHTFLVSSLYKDEGIIRFPHKWEFGPHIRIKPVGL
ncbi:MAG: ABC transporter ATP-binding protein [Acidobacteriota bacterium]|nr:ABC transporter ATP-binding protein [Acidobacteriota bacterium]